MELDKELIKIVLSSIKNTNQFGFKLLSYIKNNFKNLCETNLYLVVKFLEKSKYIKTYKELAESACCINIKYKLTLKGESLYELIERKPHEISF